MRFRIRHRETIQRPSESPRPGGVRTKSLMRVGKRPFSRSGRVRMREFGLLRPAAQSETLPVVAGVVVQGLNHGSIGAHKPLGGANGVISADIAPALVSRFV